MLWPFTVTVQLRDKTIELYLKAQMHKLCILKVYIGVNNVIKVSIKTAPVWRKKEKSALYCSHSPILRAVGTGTASLYSVNIQLCLWVEIRSYSCVLFVYSSIHYQFDSVLFCCIKSSFVHTLFVHQQARRLTVLFLFVKKKKDY